MYIEKTLSGYVGTEQVVRRARFLLLLQLRSGSTGAENTYAVVRRVALRQLGHFMMGRVNLGGKWFSVSGAYGSDGLPMTVDALPSDAKALPARLYDLWNNGGGWNGAGNEATEMAKWANETFKESRP